MARLRAVVVGCLLLACSPSPSTSGDAGTPGDSGAVDSDSGRGNPSDGGSSGPFIYIPPDPQRTGDPTAGYDELVNGNYIGCGIPMSVVPQIYGSPDSGDTLPGRTGDNAKIPFFLNAVVMDSGVEVAAPNCLQCHSESINGRRIVGLGNTTFDYTQDLAVPLEAAAALLTNPAEKAELKKFADRMSAMWLGARTRVRGVNSAETAEVALAVHHDPQTLTWTSTQVFPFPPTLQIPPIRVPPWWRMHKKNAMFYTAAGRRDHARLMMLASMFCVDTVPQAQEIDKRFVDLEAYILSLRAPPYPFAIDQTLAARGQVVFTQNCQMCHGTYGAGGSYPNLLLPLELIGTDPLLATESTGIGAPFLDWVRSSFYGQISSLDPSLGYVAPPLDGVWAVAPYLHNGSVPTLEGVLNSPTRPTYWTRSYKTAANDYDTTHVGWHYTSLTFGGLTSIYDTTQPGYSNAGHTFGDALSADDRTALIEYLKTL